MNRSSLYLSKSIRRKSKFMKPNLCESIFVSALLFRLYLVFNTLVSNTVVLSYPLNLIKQVFLFFFQLLFCFFNKEREKAKKKTRKRPGHHLMQNRQVEQRERTMEKRQQQFDIDQLINQSIYQSINQSANQSISHSLNVSNIQMIH